MFRNEALNFDLDRFLLMIVFTQNNIPVCKRCQHQQFEWLMERWQETLLYLYTVCQVWLVRQWILCMMLGRVAELERRNMVTVVFVTEHTVIWLACMVGGRRFLCILSLCTARGVINQLLQFSGFEQLVFMKRLLEIMVKMITEVFHHALHFCTLWRETSVPGTHLCL